MAIGSGLPPRGRTAATMALALTLLSFSIVHLAGAGAASAVLSVSSGQLQFIGGTPGDLSFPPLQLNGTDPQATSASLRFDVQDATGTGAGWRIEADGSAFTDGAGHSLPVDAVSIAAAPSTSCDAGSGCVPADNAVAYPLLFAAYGSTDATLFDAAPGSGMGDESIVSTFTLAIPGNARASAYRATWAFSLVAGP